MNRERTIPDTGRKLRAVVLSLFAVSAMVGYYDAEARGGGGRGGGGMRGGGGGGRMAGSSVSGANRSAPRPSTRPSTGSRPSTGTSRPSTGAVNTGSGNRPGYGSGNRPGSGSGNGNRPGNGDINGGDRGDFGSGNNINNGNINIGNDINVDIDGGYGNGWGGGWGYHHPIAAGAFIGAVAVTTAAVMGSYYYGLPSGCSPYYYNSMNYHHCGSVYYQQTMSGADVVYVVVEDPN